jgi:hypothetical protein
MGVIGFGTGDPRTDEAFQGAYRANDRAIERAVRARVRRGQGFWFGEGQAIAAIVSTAALAVVFTWNYRGADGGEAGQDDADAIAFAEAEATLGLDKDAVTLLTDPNGFLGAPAGGMQRFAAAAAPDATPLDIVWRPRGSSGLVLPLDETDAGGGPVVRQGALGPTIPAASDGAAARALGAAVDGGESVRVMAALGIGAEAAPATAW